MSDAEQIPDPLAMFDQALASIPMLVKAVRTFYEAAVDEGFSEAQALTLCGSYLAALQEAS